MYMGINGVMLKGLDYSILIEKYIQEMPEGLGLIIEKVNLVHKPFSVESPRLWISLVNDVKNVNNIKLFPKKLKIFNC